MKKAALILATLVIMIAIVVGSTLNVGAAAKTNVALDKPVESSGFIQNVDPPEDDIYINDGDMDTKWCARLEDNEVFEDEGHWIIIDLEKDTAISEFVIHMASEGERDIGQYALNLVEYTIEVSSDKKTWEKLIAEDGLYDEAEAGADVESYTKTFDPISIRYFRFTTTIPALTETTVRIPELEIIAAPEGAATVTVAQAAAKLAAAAATTAPVKTSPPPTTAAVTSPKTATPSPTKTTAATTATATSDAGTDSEEEASSNIGLIIGIIAAAVVVIGGVVFIVVKKKKS